MADGMFPEYVDAGWLLPLDDLIDKYRDEYDLDDISSTYWDKASYQGKIYGIPIIGNTEHLFYRIDLLEKYGLDVPNTFDDVMAACEVLKQEESIRIPFIMGLRDSWSWSGQFADLRPRVLHPDCGTATTRSICPLSSTARAGADRRPRGLAVLRALHERRARLGS